MDIRPCPRCRKVIPSDASFCRRCGIATRQQATRTFNGSPSAARPAEARLGSRWASTVATTATAALGVVLALFAVSGPRVAVRQGESGHTHTPAARSRASSAPGRSATARPTRRPGPAITAIAGDSAGLGHKVTIRGAGFKGTKQVVFIGTQWGRAESRYVVWDDDRLVASVPDLGPWGQDAAVVVVTNEGVAFSVPFDARTVDSSYETAPRGKLCVVRSGDVFAGDGTPLLLVEGRAAARVAPGGTLFVRSGGSLWGHGGGDCLVYCERGVLTRSDVTACDLVEVDIVNPCRVPSLLHYAGR